MSRDVIGRRRELVRLGGFVQRRMPGFAALTLEGEPGIGKSTLWFEGVRLATESGFAVLSARPTSGETRLPYSALGDILRHVDPGQLGAIGEPLAGALREAALLDAGPGELPDERLVARGLADVLLGSAREAQLLVAIDDVQWLDERSLSALAYALRRLVETDARVLLARRPPAGMTTVLQDALPATHVDLLTLGPLTLATLSEILLERTGTALPRPALVRVLKASGGNPYYALEIARELDAAGLEPTGTLRLPADVTRLTANRILRLPASTRPTLLRLALASRRQDGATAGDLQPAIDDGVLEFEADGTLRFSHPLVATAVVDVATPLERRRAHLELAKTEIDEVERARHLALAATPPDLEAAAAAAAGYEAAVGRGDASSALELAELALQLTPREETALRLVRAGEFSECLDAAGAAADGRAVLEREISAAPSGLERGRALAQLGWTCWRDDDLASGIVACRRALEESDDLALRCEIYETLIWLYEDDLEEACSSGRALVEAREQQGDPILVPRARLLAAYFAIVAGYPPDQAQIEADIEELERQNVLHQNPVPEMWAKFTDRLDDAREILVARLGFARETTDEQFLVACLFALGEIDTWRGSFRAARAFFDEAFRLQDDLAGTTYLGSLHACAAQLAALEGRIEDAERHAAEALPVSHKAVAAALARSAAGCVAFNRGSLEAADEQYSAASALLEGVGMREPARLRYDGDHVEVLVTLGDLDRAAALTARLEERYATFPRPWLGVQAKRSQALILGAQGDLAGALASADEAEQLGTELPMPFERARTNLVRGRLLRRTKQRGAARASLEQALAAFEALPAPRWAAAARDELSRLGLSRSGDDLTEVERVVAEAAAEGLRNREIAARLFMSPKTVEAHLSRVYRKLGVRTRAELATRLPPQG